MFGSIKRLIGAGAQSNKAAHVLANWAKAEGHAFKHVKHAGGKGYAVESAAGWRVEWGTSQRPYIVGSELRFRCETGVESDVQMVLLTRVLAQTLESDVFSRYTNAMQTQVDTSLPDEMRWLAIHPKVSVAESATLNRRFTLLCNAGELAKKWFDASLIEAFDRAADCWWSDALVLVITLNRGMLTARMSGQPLEVAQLKLVGELFSCLADRLRAAA